MFRDDDIALQARVEVLTKQLEGLDGRLAEGKQQLREAGWVPRGETRKWIVLAATLPLLVVVGWLLVFHRPAAIDHEATLDKLQRTNADRLARYKRLNIEHLTLLNDRTSLETRRKSQATRAGLILVIQHRRRRNSAKTGSPLAREQEPLRLGPGCNGR